MQNLAPSPFDITDLCEKTNFHYLRYGHGAQRAMVGDTIINCDGHSLGFPEMREDLVDSIMNPCRGDNVLYGLMEIGRYVKGFKEPIIELFNSAPVTHWVDGDIFYPAIVEKKAHIYLRFLQKPEFDICLVGPPHLEKMDEHLNVTAHFKTDKNCYLQKNEAMQFLKRNQQDFNVVLFAAAMLSEVLIHKLHDQFMDKALIDVGAFFDPLCGVRSRGYAQRLSDNFLRHSFLGDPSSHKSR